MRRTFLGREKSHSAPSSVSEIDARSLATMPMNWLPFSKAGSIVRISAMARPKRLLSGCVTSFAIPPGVWPIWVSVHAALLATCECKLASPLQSLTVSELWSDSFLAFPWCTRQPGGNAYGTHLMHRKSLPMRSGSLGWSSSSPSLRLRALSRQKMTVPGGKPG